MHSIITPERDDNEIQNMEVVITSNANRRVILLLNVEWQYASPCTRHEGVYT